MIVFAYIVQHLSSLFLLKRNTNILYVLVSLIVLIYIYAAKNDSYDIFSYTSAVSHSYIFEPLYAALVAAINFFIKDPRSVIAVVQSVLAILWITMIFAVKKEKRPVALFIIVSSLMFTLSVNNGLRQGIAIVFIIYSIFSLLNSRYFLFLFLSLVAFGFHESSILFSLLVMIIFVIFEYGYMKRGSYRSISSSTFILIIFLLAAFGLVLLDVLMLSGFYSEYTDRVITFENGRVPLYIKIFPLMFIFLISEYFCGRYSRVAPQLTLFRFLRLFVILMVSMLAFNRGFDEMGSRVLMFYFGVELLFSILAFEQGKNKSAVIILVGYAFAINAWRILGA
jgi:hypothetical protein